MWAALLYVCLVAPTLTHFPFVPKKADPVPAGYHEVMRVEVKHQSHVIFQKDHHWRLYIDGTFDCEGDDGAS